MKVLEFRYLNTDDRCDVKYTWCSRVYEYPKVLDFLKSIKSDGMSIHNTSSGIGDWLWQRQKDFMQELDQNYDVKHTDIDKFNIVSGHDDNQYDVVLNISTIEHLNSGADMLKALDNLWSIVKPNGYLVLTFDLPKVDLNMVENWCGCKCEDKPKNAVNGLTSAFPQPQYKDYYFIILILNKNE